MGLVPALILFYLIVFVVVTLLCGAEIAILLILGSIGIVVAALFLFSLAGVSNAFYNTKETRKEMRISHSLGEPYYTYDRHGNKSTIDAERKEL